MRKSLGTTSSYLKQQVTVARNASIKISPKYDFFKLEKGPDANGEMKGEQAVTMLQQMIRIRRTENKTAELYRSRLINGFLHLYAGQEAVGVGLKNAMQEKDNMITSYRCHAFAMLFGATSRQIFAELMGRSTGVSKGKGGSMHMYGPQFFGGDGIVGGQVPVGTGLAFAHKYNSTGGVAFTLYGDGAASQGQVFEAWNMAKLWNLPVVYICENNKYGMGTATHRHSANDQFYTRGDNIPGIKVDGMKVEDVWHTLKFAREYALHNGPILIEMVTYRYFGHSMSDPGTSYRSREEIKTVKEKHDPIKNFTETVIREKIKTKEEIDAMTKTIRKEVDKQFEESKKDPWPEIGELATEVYAKKLEPIRGMAPWVNY